jgi:hypothetical protein
MDDNRESKEFREELKRLQANDPTLQRHYFLYPCPILASAMGRALMTNTHLRQLILNILALDERSAVDLADGICYSKIEELKISSKVFEDQMVLWQHVFQGVQASSTIRHLVLSFGYTPVTTSMDWLGNALSSLATLEKLTLKQFPGIVIDQVLSNILSKSSSLTTLSLSTDADDVDVCHLVQILRQSSSLTRLELEGYSINNHNLQMLVDCWHPNLSIRTLCFNGTCFDSSGLQILLRAIAADHMLLHKLYLTRNFRLGCDGLRIFGEALPLLTTVTHVSFAFSGLYGNHRKKACQALLNGTKLALQLQKVEISESDILHEFRNEISFYADLIQHGRYLLASHHGLASTVWCHILGKCQGPHGVSSIFYFLREQPSLVQPRRGQKQSRPVRYSPCRNKVG